MDWAEENSLKIIREAISGQAEEFPPDTCLDRLCKQARRLPVKSAAQQVECQVAFSHYTVSMKVRCTRLNITMPRVSSITMKAKL